MGTKVAEHERDDFRSLLPEGFPLPFDFDAEDGERGLYWKTDNTFIDVSFYGDGWIYYYGRNKAKDVESAAAEPFTNHIPNNLWHVLETLKDQPHDR